MGCGVSGQPATITNPLHDNLTLNRIYQRKELIGSGTFGKVYRCINQLNGLEYALKVVEITAKNKQQATRQISNLKSEISVLKKLNHPNIIKYYSFDISPDNKNVEIVLELAKLGSLNDVLKKQGPFSETQAAKKCKQILQGLKYLHSQSVVHRDLKCANILVSADGTLKISDFGTAKQIKIQSNQDIARMCASLKGTPYYMAPEILKRSGHNASADVWSFGCTLIEMLTGKPPWAGLTSNFEEIISYIISGIHPPFPPGLSSDCECFLQSCLDPIPSQRLTSQQLLKHRFIDTNELERSRKNSSLSYQTPLYKQNETLKTKHSRNECFLDEKDDQIEQIGDSQNNQLASRNNQKYKQYEEFDSFDDNPQISKRTKVKIGKPAKQKVSSFKVTDSKRYIEPEDIEISPEKVQIIKKGGSKLSKNRDKDAINAQTVPNLKATQKILQDLKQIEGSQNYAGNSNFPGKQQTPAVFSTNKADIQITIRAKTEMGGKQGEINSIISREERLRYLQAQKVLKEQRDQQKRKWERELKEGGAFLQRQISSRYQL